MLETREVLESQHAFISAEYNGSVVEDFVTVLPVDRAGLADFTLAATSVRGGGVVEGHLRLHSANADEETFIEVLSDSALARVQTPVRVDRGQTTATFSIEADNVSRFARARITASLGETSITRTLAILPADVISIESVTIEPATVEGGRGAVATVTLSGPAPPPGVELEIVSTNPRVFVPQTLTISDGRRGSFEIATGVVTVQEDAQLLVRLDQTTVSASLTLTPSSPENYLAALSITPAEVLGGQSATGTVRLSAPAPFGGLEVLLGSSNPAAQVPRSVRIDSDQTTSRPILITTQGVSTSVDAAISASLVGAMTSATLTIRPVNWVSLAGIELVVDDVLGGVTASAVVTLTNRAITPVSVSLTSDNSAAVVASAVVVEPGSTSVPVSIFTSPVNSSQTAVISATVGGVTRTGQLLIRPLLQITSLTVTPSSVVGGNNAVGRIQFNGIAGGERVSLSDDQPAVNVPASVVVPGNQDFATFQVSTNQTMSDLIATITALHGVVSLTATLGVTPRAEETVTVQLLGDFNQSGATADVVHLGDNPNDFRFIPPDPSGTELELRFALSEVTDLTLRLDQYQADNTIVSQRSFVTFNGHFLGYLSHNPGIRNLSGATSIPVKGEVFDIDSSKVVSGENAVMIHAGNVFNPGDTYDDLCITNVRITYRQN